MTLNIRNQKTVFAEESVFDEVGFFQCQQKQKAPPCEWGFCLILVGRARFELATNGLKDVVVRQITNKNNDLKLQNCTVQQTV